VSGKDAPVHAMKDTGRGGGGKRNNSTHFYSRHYMNVSDQLNAPTALPCKETRHSLDTKSSGLHMGCEYFEEREKPFATNAIRARSSCNIRYRASPLSVLINRDKSYTFYYYCLLGGDVIQSGSNYQAPEKAACLHSLP